MNLKHLAAAAAIAAGVGISGLTSGVGLVNAAPIAPIPTAPAFQPDPGGPPPGLPAEKCWRGGRVGGGNPRGGGGVPGYLPQCKGPAPALPN
jgi:hypothetical protein